MKNFNIGTESTPFQIEDNFSAIKKQYEEINTSDYAADYALIYMNIKHFDSFNLQGEWHFGTQVIEMVYKVICKHINNDEYLTHLFADHFIILMKYDDCDHLKSRLMKIIKDMYALNNPILYRNIFASFGIYELSFEHVGFYKAVLRANIAGKSSKFLENRSFCYEFYRAEMMTTYMTAIKLEHDTAMAYQNNEFVPFLQPKVDPMTNQIIGAEALLRWFDKDGTMIPVYTFLPILNQNEYIVLIDLDIFDQVCKALDEQIKQGLSVVPVSFNISKACFYTKSFLQDYIDIFEKYQIPKNLIEFELMESITMDDTKKLNETIQDIKKAGFTCILDDFGAGYSSFSILLNADLDEIKVDRQFFVNELNDENRRLIKTVIDLIHSLNMRITAEGIETKEYVDLLKSCNVEYIQGFYYYKPLPMSDFFNILNKQ